MTRTWLKPGSGITKVACPVGKPEKHEFPLFCVAESFSFPFRTNPIHQWRSEDLRYKSKNLFSILRAKTELRPYPTAFNRTSLNM